MIFEVGAAVRAKRVLFSRLKPKFEPNSCYFQGLAEVWNKKAIILEVWAKVWTKRLLLSRFGPGFGPKAVTFEVSAEISAKRLLFSRSQ